MVDRGKAAVQMLKAAVLGRPFGVAGVPDIPRNGQAFAEIQAEVAAIPPGTMIDIPAL